MVIARNNRLAKLGEKGNAILDASVSVVEISGRIHITAPAVKRQELMGGGHTGAFPEDRAHRCGHRQSLDAPGLQR
jgi:hypothetical protein